MPPAQYWCTAVAAPPLSLSTTIGLPANAIDSTVASVPGPPCTTSCTRGTFLVLAISASSADLNAISDPHAFEPTWPLSTKIKCVWLELIATPSEVQELLL